MGDSASVTADGRTGTTGGGSSATPGRRVEVHRLAVAGREPVIAREVGRKLGGVWLGWSRFADVAALARSTLTLGPDAASLNQLGWAQSSMGQPRPALTCYQQALDLYREVGNPRGEAITLSNIGLVYSGLGDR